MLAYGSTWPPSPRSPPVWPPLCAPPSKTCPSGSAKTRWRGSRTRSAFRSRPGDTEPVQVSLRFARAWGGQPRRHVFGSPDRIPAPGGGAGQRHMPRTPWTSTTPTCPVDPAPERLGSACRSCRSGGSGCRRRTFLAAVAAGNEIAIRLGMAAHDERTEQQRFLRTRPARHLDLRRHRLGGAAAVGLRAERRQSRTRWASPARMGAGLLEANRTGGTVKRMHCGWAAHSGVIAAQMSASGITAPDPRAGRPLRLLQRLHRHPPDRSRLRFLDGLGEAWELDNCFVKPYPTNVFTHTGIDAARAPGGRGHPSRRHRKGGSVRADGGHPHDRRTPRSQDQPADAVPRAVQRAASPSPSPSTVAPGSGSTSTISPRRPWTTRSIRRLAARRALHAGRRVRGHLSPALSHHRAGHPVRRRGHRLSARY